MDGSSAVKSRVQTNELNCGLVGGLVLRCGTFEVSLQSRQTLLRALYTVGAVVIT